MHRFLVVAVIVAIGFFGGTSAGAQGVSALERRVAPRPPLMPTLSEFLRPVEARKLDNLGLRPMLALLMPMVAGCENPLFR